MQEYNIHLANGIVVATKNQPKKVFVLRHPLARNISNCSALLNTLHLTQLSQAAAAGHREARHMANIPSRRTLPAGSTPKVSASSNFTY